MVDILVAVSLYAPGKRKILGDIFLV